MINMDMYKNDKTSHLIQQNLSWKQDFGLNSKNLIILISNIRWMTYNYNAQFAMENANFEYMFLYIYIVFVYLNLPMKSVTV